MSKLLEYMQNANHPADVYIEKASDDSSADDSSSSEGSGFLSGLRNFLFIPCRVRPSCHVESRPSLRILSVRCLHQT